MKRIALFPGSFDPFTKGHESVIKKALPLFDEIVIGVGFNTTKTPHFTLDSRINQIESIYAGESKIVVNSFQKLTVDFCKDINATFILRGLRDTKDFEYEKAIAQMNQQLAEIETVFFMTDPVVSAISASIVREISKNGGIIEQFVTNSHLLVS